MRKVSSDFEEDVSELPVSDSEAPEDLVTSRISLPTSRKCLKD